MKIDIDQKTIEKIVEEQIKQKVSFEIKKIDVHRYVDNAVKDAIHDRMYKIGNSGIDEMAGMCYSKEIIAWFEDTIRRDDLMSILKSAMVEKLKGYTLEELKDLIDSLIKK